MRGQLDAGAGSGRRNSFDLIRHAAAVMVIIGHSYVLTGYGHAPTIGGVAIHALGVDVFFIISGALITASWHRDPSLRRFLARRALRIFSALFAVVLLTVLVVGPCLTTLTAADYFHSTETWMYLANLATIGVYPLPGLFAHHWTNAVNGCLWTLGLELCSYVVVALARIGRRRNPVPCLLALAGIAIVLLAIAGDPDRGLGATGRVWFFFAAGGLLTALPLTRLSHPLFAVGAAAAWFGATIWHIGADATWIALPVIVLSAARIQLPNLHRVPRVDLSYGLYLWGFVVEQILIERFGAIDPATTAALTLLVSGGIAWLSWHAIEQPALRSKPLPRSMNLAKGSAATRPA